MISVNPPGLKQEINNLNQAIGLPVGDWRPPPYPRQDPITGRFCRLEPLKPEIHARSLFEANGQDAEGRSWTYLPYGPFDSFEDYLAWMQANCEGSDPLFFAIIGQQTNQALGVASYLRITPAAGSIEVGHLNFSPRLQRTPAATEAMYLMMAKAFSLGYRRYEWKCNALNTPSRIAAQRLGLSFEGVFRQATVSKGRNRDTAWYAAIDEDWPALQNAFQQWLRPENFDPQGRQRQSLSALTSTILVKRG